MLIAGNARNRNTFEQPAVLPQTSLGTDDLGQQRARNLEEREQFVIPLRQYGG